MFLIILAGIKLSEDSMTYTTLAYIPAEKPANHNGNSINMSLDVALIQGMLPRAKQ